MSSGISNLDNESIDISYEKDKLKFKKKIKVSLPRLSYKTFYLSKILSKKLEGGIIKIRQPKQKLFYGRMLAGRLNKKTKALAQIIHITTLRRQKNILIHLKVIVHIHILKIIKIKSLCIRSLAHQI